MKYNDKISGYNNNSNKLIKPSNIKTSIIIIGMLIVFAAFMLLSHHLQLQNNGDGSRIMRSAQILATGDFYSWQPFPRLYEFQDIGNIKPKDLIPVSSGAAIVELISFAERAVNFKKFDFLWVTAFYSAVYLFGILLILLNLRLVFAIPMLLILVNPYVLAYFNSPYEESLFIALCPIFSFFFIKEGISSGFAIKTIALAMASTKIQFAPLLLFGIKNFKLRNNIVYMLVSILVIGATVVKIRSFSGPNNYDRYFNGLSYSMSEVSTWPVNEFIERRSIAGKMTASKDIIFPAESSYIRKYWGSSFWPTGNKLDAIERKYVYDNVDRWFWETVIVNPKYYYRLLTEPIFTMVKADYRISYIFNSDMKNRWMDIHALVMQNFGVIFLLLSISSLVISIRNKNPVHVLFVLFLLMYPLIVVYGAAYHEFEKHLFPVMFLGVVFSIALSFMSISKSVTYSDLTSSR